MSPVAELSQEVTIYELARDDHDRQQWQKLDVVSAAELGFGDELGAPLKPGDPQPQTEAMLGAWFGHADPLPGVYRAERPGCRAIILHWPGRKAVA